MKEVVTFLALLTLTNCAHLNVLSETEVETTSDLGVVILDYYDEHLKVVVNGQKIFDELVYADRSGSGLSASFVVKTGETFLIDFCVDDHCRGRSFSRTKKDIYLLIAPRGPIATTPPHMELTDELGGLD